MVNFKVGDLIKHLGIYFIFLGSLDTKRIPKEYLLLSVTNEPILLTSFLFFHPELVSSFDHVV